MPRPTTTQLWVYAALAVAIVALGLRSLLAPAGPPPGPETRPGGPPAAAGAGAGAGAVTVAEAPPSSAIVVHVVGAVAAPGLYRLRDGARVADALARAGGATGKAALEGVNLAAKLADGQQVVVPKRGAAAAASAGAGGGAAPGAPGAPGAPAAGPVSLSSATLEQLDALPGVGPATAQKILDHRESSGGFRSVDDLANVPGIGPKKLAALREAVTP